MPHGLVSGAAETESSNISRSSITPKSNTKSELGDMVAFACAKLDEWRGIPDDEKERLRLFFSQTLAFDPMDRSTDIEHLICALTDE